MLKAIVLLFGNLFFVYCENVKTAGYTSIGTSNGGNDLVPMKDNTVSYYPNEMFGLLGIRNDLNAGNFGQPVPNDASTGSNLLPTTNRGALRNLDETLAQVQSSANSLAPIGNVAASAIAKMNDMDEAMTHDPETAPDTAPRHLPSTDSDLNLVPSEMTTGSMMYGKGASQLANQFGTSSTGIDVSPINKPSVVSMGPQNSVMVAGKRKTLNSPKQAWASMNGIETNSMRNTAYAPIGQGTLTPYQYLQTPHKETVPDNSDKMLSTLDMSTEGSFLNDKLVPSDFYRRERLANGKQQTSRRHHRGPKSRDNVIFDIQQADKVSAGTHEKFPDDEMVSKLVKSLQDDDVSRKLMHGGQINPPYGVWNTTTNLQP